MADFDPKVPEHSADADVLLLGNLDPVVQLSVLERMKTQPKLVILDTMNFWMDIAWDNLMKVIAKTDVITINDEEARQLSGEYSLVKAAKKIHEMGLSFVIIKKRRARSIIIPRRKSICNSGIAFRKGFDPTGAGDTFAGGFASYLTKKGDFSFESMKTAIIVGSAMASFTVEKFGTENSASNKTGAK